MRPLRMALAGLWFLDDIASRSHLNPRFVPSNFSTSFGISFLYLSSSSSIHDCAMLDFAFDCVNVAHDSNFV